MKQFLEYQVDKLIPCIAERPSMFDYKWNPLNIQIESESFFNDKPVGFNILNLDNEGVVVEKWTIAKIEEYNKINSNTIIKFGFAYCNY